MKFATFLRTPFLQGTCGRCFCYYNIKYTTIKYTIKNSLFLGNKCVTLSEGFKTVCLTKNVLKTALSGLNDLRGDNVTDTGNCASTYAGYKQYTFVRKVISSCAVWAIKNNYPSKDGKTLRHGCSPVSLLHIFRTPFLKNTSGRLLPAFATQ